MNAEMMKQHGEFGPSDNDILILVKRTIAKRMDNDWHWKPSRIMMPYNIQRPRSMEAARPSDTRQRCVYCRVLSTPLFHGISAAPYIPDMSVVHARTRSLVLRWQIYKRSCLRRTMLMRQKT